MYFNNILMNFQMLLEFIYLFICLKETFRIDDTPHMQG